MVRELVLVVTFFFLRFLLAAAKSINNLSHCSTSIEHYFKLLFSSWEGGEGQVVFTGTYPSFFSKMTATKKELQACLKSLFSESQVTSICPKVQNKPPTVILPASIRFSHNSGNIAICKMTNPFCWQLFLQGRLCFICWFLGSTSLNK